MDAVIFEFPLRDTVSFNPVTDNTCDSKEDKAKLKTVLLPLEFNIMSY